MSQPAPSPVAPFGVQRSTRLRLVVISPESEDPREPTVLTQLFAAGLTDYHLRKPAWTRDRLAAFLRALPPEHHRRLILHTHHDLASDFPLAGLHHRDRRPSEKCHVIRDILHSRAVHDLAALRATLDRRDRVLFSPVFPSISKPGHAPAFPRADLRALLALPRRAEVIALGGIDATRLAACRDLGFDGVAVLGAVWQSPDPLAAFSHLRDIASLA